MKTIILCGGIGTRLKEETEFKPKPLVHIGDRPILWHIMKIYQHYGFNEFVLTLGYKGSMIKDYFLNYNSLVHDFTLKTNTSEINNRSSVKDDFIITFAETGLKNLTGSRILQVEKYIDDDTFMLTYGDGVADVNVKELVDFHKKQGTIATITGVHPYSKYGQLQIDHGSNLVREFKQKPLMNDYVNGGLMVLNKEAFNYFDEDQMEKGLSRLAQEGQLSVFKHDGFWKAMDTYQEMQELNELWQSTKPWAVWKNSSDIK